MKYYLFLDDIRFLENMVQKSSIYDERKNPWKVVRNYSEFIDIIKKDGIPELVSFDHDIGDEHYGIDWEDFKYFSSEQLGVAETGMDCAEWLIAYCDKHDQAYPECIVHSANPVGRENIIRFLKSKEVKVHVIR